MNEELLARLRAELDRATRRWQIALAIDVDDARLEAFADAAESRFRAWQRVHLRNLRAIPGLEETT